MARPQVADEGDGLQIWRVAANILNKQWRTADRGGPPAWGLGGGLTTPHKNFNCYEIYHRASGQHGFFGKTTQAPKKGYKIWHLECGTHGGGERLVQGFCGKTRRKKTTWKTKA
jgi:hypothetical protein